MSGKRRLRSMLTPGWPNACVARSRLRARSFLGLGSNRSWPSEKTGSPRLLRQMAGTFASQPMMRRKDGITYAARRRPMLDVHGIESRPILVGETTDSIRSRARLVRASSTGRRWSNGSSRSRPPEGSGTASTTIGERCDSRDRQARASAASRTGSRPARRSSRPDVAAMSGAMASRRSPAPPTSKYLDDTSTTIALFGSFSFRGLA
jgi:hypothetical protein